MPPLWPPAQSVKMCSPGQKTKAEELTIGVTYLPCINDVSGGVSCD